MTLFIFVFLLDLSLVASDNTFGIGDHDGYSYDDVPAFGDQAHEKNPLANQMDLGVRENE